MIRIYRADIDGLRAIAVISVILFHLGFIENGYLGVDVFFVISGYLITGIIYREVIEGKFSILNFYERRIRRIIPLVLITTFTAFVLGLFFMLPDDLENLSQSVISSNFSANNILMRITSADYWAIKNDYKPLMHTWSLGIEEQFYFIYPFLFFFLKGEKSKYILPSLIAITLLSISVFLIKNNVSNKFYFIQYRFFELSIGGISAIYFNNNDSFKKNQSLLFGLLLLLISLLFFPFFIENNELKIILTVFITTSILIVGNFHFQSNKIYKNIISNKIIAGIGKISFSLYMWHQIVFAFARYTKFEVLTPAISAYLIVIILFLSIASYKLIENPFRNKNFMPSRYFYLIISSAFVLTISSSFYVYLVGGIVKNVPELSLEYSLIPEKLNLFNRNDNIQIHYNEKVRKYDKSFSNTKILKVLVIGDSYGRDFSNILFESKFAKTIEVRYFDSQRILTDVTLIKKLEKADQIFISKSGGININFLKNIEQKYNYTINQKKLIVVGIKDFGYNNGIHYNKKKYALIDCNNYRTRMKDGVLKKNMELKTMWEGRYIDLIDLVSDSKNHILVYTPDCKFISQDTKHLTKFGALFYAELLEERLNLILNQYSNLIVQ